MIFKAEYYPEEIAAALMKLDGEAFVMEDEGRPESEYTECLYTLMAICENKYNNDYYRSFYRLLERIAAAHDRADA